MGLTNNQLQLINAVCQNKMTDVKKMAILCLKEDKTAKNQYQVKRYLNILENADNSGLMEIPYQIKGMINVEDSSKFRVDRYYLSERESDLAERVEKLNDAGLKLMEMGIPYLNSILLTGVSGTGKTTFGRYMANRLDLPFLYINFSYLIDSYMGGTGKNIRQVFDYARLNKCLLMLDEIDAIASIRTSGSSGTDKERATSTITLIQELDKIQNDTIIIGATNIPQDIDPAIKRRFAISHEVKIFDAQENQQMVLQYLNTTGLNYNQDDINSFIRKMPAHTQQAVILNKVVECIAKCIIENSDTIQLSSE